MSERTRIPLYGTRVEQDYRKGIRGLVIKSSDCELFAPPPEVHEKHAELQKQIDSRKVKDDEQHGWIEHNEDGEVTDWEIDDDLLA